MLPKGVFLSLKRQNRGVWHDYSISVNESQQKYEGVDKNSQMCYTLREINSQNRKALALSGKIFKGSEKYSHKERNAGASCDRGHGAQRRAPRAGMVQMGGAMVQEAAGAAGAGGFGCPGERMLLRSRRM